MIIAAVIVGIVVIIAGLFVYALAHGAALPSGIHVRDISVTDNQITIQADFAGNSSLMYNGYKAVYRNEILYVSIVTSLLHSWSISGDPFTVIIPNTYGTIKSVYLKGVDPEGDKLIWP